MEKIIGVKTEGGVEWHASNPGPTDHVTLCGLDGDDHFSGQYGVVKARRGQKITYHECLCTFQGFRDLKLRASDFAT